MASLVIKDLEQNVELDRLAMRQIVGGSARMSSATFQRNVAKHTAPGPAGATPLSISKVQWSPLLRPAAKR
jgi:hypothetical protein